MDMTKSPLYVIHSKAAGNLKVNCQPWKTGRLKAFIAELYQENSKTITFITKPGQSNFSYIERHLLPLHDKVTKIL